MKYHTLPGMRGYKIGGYNIYDYIQPNSSQPFDKKFKHKYQVGDQILDVSRDQVGLIQELLIWPNYLIYSSDGSWMCNEAHITCLKDLYESSPSINNLDYWEEEPTQHDSLSTKITDITDTEDITILKNEVDLANDGGICAIDTVNKHDHDIEEIRYDVNDNMQKTADIEVKTHDIEQRVYDIEKRQKKISKLSKLALLSRFL